MLIFQTLTPYYGFNILRFFVDRPSFGSSMDFIMGLDKSLFVLYGSFWIATGAGLYYPQINNCLVDWERA